MRAVLFSMLSSCVARVAQFYIWLLFVTSKIEVMADSKALEILKSDEACIIALWHNRILLFPKYMRQFGSFRALISMHRDGDFLAKFLAVYNHGCVRGSSRHGAFRALKEIISCLKSGERIVITPDGPLGPPFIINSNIINIALKTKVSIVPVSYNAKRKTQLRTWDKFIVPYLFNHITININAPVCCDPKVPEAVQSKALQTKLCLI